MNNQYPPEPGKGFLALLDPNPATAEQKYLMLRAKLIFYFLQRRCPDPEELADEVVLRAHRRLAEGVEVKSELVNFCYGIAWRVCMEQKPPVVEFNEDLHGSLLQDAAMDRDKLILIGQCLGSLDAADCQFIRDYFEDDHGELAERLGKSPNALRIRAFRIVEMLRAFSRKRTPGRAHGAALYSK